MTDSAEPLDPTRRNVVLAGLGAAAAAVLAACARNGSATDTAAAAQGAPTTTASVPTSAAAASPSTTAASPATPAPTILAATPACVDDDDVTPEQTEGPYFKPNSPERANIRGDAAGTKLLVTGTVVTTSCKPVAKALLDVWQADTAGNYDNSGFGFRGHLFTDAQGGYQFETVIPGLYPGRTRHIHVKVQAPGGKVLTTQLYFPGEPRNATDGIYRKECDVVMADAADGKKATFAFVLNG